MTSGSGWGEFLEHQPNWRTAYFGYQDQARSPNQTRYFQSRFSDVQDRFMGLQGKQIMGDEIPSLTFEDFLAKYFAPGGGEAQQWGSMSPGQRGVDVRRFAPPTRFNF